MLKNLIDLLWQMFTKPCISILSCVCVSVYIVLVTCKERFITYENFESGGSLRTN